MRQILALGCMAAFYLIYFAKAFLQGRRGIRTNVLGQGQKAPAVRRAERIVSMATLSIVPVELWCIAFVPASPALLFWPGLLLALFGVAAFAASVWQMGDSWRAGIPETGSTALITGGVYSFSRNPAFLGFDCVYLGVLLCFFHPIHLLFALFAFWALHRQILQEEQFLAAAFGKEYSAYRRRTNRYLGLK